MLRLYFPRRRTNSVELTLNKQHQLSLTDFPWWMGIEIPQGRTLINALEKLCAGI